MWPFLFGNDHLGVCDGLIYKKKIPFNHKTITDFFWSGGKAVQIAAAHGEFLAEFQT